jgi:hypothetical protein
MFYKSLAASDAVSCKLLARGARIQRGRVAALTRRITALQKQNAPQTEIEKLTVEAARRKTLAEKFDTLDGVIDQAIKDRALLDVNKFK